MKSFVIVLLLAAGVAGGAFYWNKTQKAQGAEADAGPPTLVVERGAIDLNVETTGRVVANLDVDIKSKASGTIIQLPFDVSDEVTSGALLAELDPVDENRNVSQRETSMLSARAELEKAREQLQMAITDMDTGTSGAIASLEAARVRSRDARNKLQRQEDLAKRQLVSREELDASRTEAAAAEQSLTQAELAVAETRKLPRTVELRRHDISLMQARVQQAAVDLENAEQRLRETKIYAPMDGVITVRPVQTGQIIASGISNVGGGTSLMTLSDLSRMFVNASVDEADIGKVAVGQEAIITADAFPGKKFKGVVQRIATQGTNKSDVVTFEVKIEIDGQGREVLKPEMTANVKVQAESRDNALLLANEAIQTRREEYCVEVPGTTDTAKLVMVEIGITDGLNTEIVSGLEEGQKVLLPGSLQSKWSREGSAGGGMGGSDIGRSMRRASSTLRGGGGRH